MGTKPPTGSDVARLAGVSKSAVSRYYTAGIVSETTREKIKRAADTLKYRPSYAARSLSTSESRLIGVAITHLDNQYYPEVIERISESLSLNGYRIVLFITRSAETEAALDPVIDEILSYRLAGIILASSSIAAHLANECIASGVPTLMFNNTDLDHRIPGVSADNATGAKTVARYLVAAGHRRFGIISGLSESSTSVDRSAAFMVEIQRAGFDAPMVASGDFTFSGAQAAMKRLLTCEAPVDAVFCVNDHMALAALQTAHELGFVPGRAVSVAGFDNVPIAAWPCFSLTTYAQPVQDMVNLTVRRLIATIDRGTPEDGIAYLPGRLLVRSSTRRAPGIVRDGAGVEYWEPANVR